MLRESFGHYGSMIRVVLVVTFLAVATPALADPCEAPVKGYKPGQKITGQVHYAGDGDSLFAPIS